MDGEQTSIAEATFLEETYKIRDGVEAFMQFNSFNIEFEGDNVP